ncbi:hypothetical protein ABZ746_39205 [Streptomyces sp. NPDC020096]
MALISARIRRRAVSVGLALLVGVSGLAWNSDGGGSAPSARGDSTVNVAAADYGTSVSNTAFNYTGQVTRESQQEALGARAETATPGDGAELDQAAAEAKQTIADLNDSQKTPKSEKVKLEGTKIDGLVARAKDNPDPNRGEFGKDELAKALNDLSDMLRTKTIDSQSRGALGGPVLRAIDRHQLAEAMAEVRTAKYAADNEAAEGTKVYAGIGAKQGRQRVDLGDGTIADVSDIDDADVVYKGKDGDINVVEVKNTGQAATKAEVIAQAGRLGDWKKASPGRQARYEIATQKGWEKIFGPFQKDRKTKEIPEGTAAGTIAAQGLDLRVAGQDISSQQLQEMSDAWNEKTGADKKAALDSGKMTDPKTAMEYLGIATQGDASVKQAVEEADKELGMTQPPGHPGDPAAPCSPPNTSQTLDIAAMFKTAPCGDGESGLSSALSSPTYGGVDFSSLQLRYLSDHADSGVQYAFSAKAAQKGLEQDSRSGLSALVESMADLRTWLVLSPDKFWVNLNPSEPDRIIDTELGQTNAGRALLEADWQMKQTEGRLLDPKTSFGAEYWRRLGGSSGQVCYSSRMWIVPGDVEVREDGDSLYVLKASLEVKAKAEDVAGLGQTSCNADPAETARNEQLEQEMVVPEIVKAVNTDPEYAPLRRAFLARVVAQWIRDRHAGGHSTSFDKLIDSGDVGPASLHGSWQPKQVYDAYLHSINEGDFTYKLTTQVGNTTITYVMRTGGVDFSKLPSSKLSSAEMDRQVPELSQTVRQAAGQPATASDGSIWLGDTARSPQVSTWDRIRTYLGGRTGMLIVLVAALGCLLFFIRDGSAFRRKTSG